MFFKNKFFLRHYYGKKTRDENPFWKNSGNRVHRIAKLNDLDSALAGELERLLTDPVMSARVCLVVSRALMSEIMPASQSGRHELQPQE